MTNIFKILTLTLCLSLSGGLQAQTNKPAAKPASQVRPQINIDDILNKTDTATFSAIKRLDEQIKQADEKIATTKAAQKKPSTDLSLESREAMLLKNDAELYTLYSERETLILKKKELRRKSMNHSSNKGKENE